MFSPLIHGTRPSREVLTHLPLFVELSDGSLQALLLLLGENVSELVTCFQESVEHPLVQLAEKLLAWTRGRVVTSVSQNKRQHQTPDSEAVTPLNKPLSQLVPSSNLLGDYHFVFRNKL